MGSGDLADGAARGGDVGEGVRFDMVLPGCGIICIVNDSAEKLEAWLRGHAEARADVELVANDARALVEWAVLQALIAPRDRIGQSMLQRLAQRAALVEQRASASLLH
jgi:hypothetical protein